MKNYDEILENLQTQKKQVEAQFLKIEGAIEIITSLKSEKDTSEKALATAQRTPKAKK
tara:strand:- start:1466 stop:1639 length:174 start_codon:yes stop_codon:yes gene_type:complete